MNRKPKTLVVVVAMVLVVVLIGLPSMKFVQKLSAGCPFSQSKAAMNCNPCIYHTVASPTETGDLGIAVSMSSLCDVQVSPAIPVQCPIQESATASTSVLRSPVLRC